MDKRMIGLAITDYINAFYPNGGYEAFKKDGGLFLVDPLIDDQVLLHHPKMPKEFKALLEEKSLFSIRYMSSHNFQHLPDERVEENIHNTVHSVMNTYTTLEDVLVNPGDPLCLYITLKGNLYEEEIKDIADMFSKINGLVNGIILYMDQMYPFGGQVLNDNKNNDERTSISKDDYLNTIISINQDKDVLDIINEL